MSVESLKSFFDVASVVLLFLTFAAGAGVLITGNIINKRQAAQLRQFDKDLTDSKERAADLENKAQRLKAQNLATEQKLETERDARVKYEAEHAPRRVSSAQATVLREHLSKLRGHKLILFRMTDETEVTDFADDILAALRSADIEVEPRRWQINHGLRGLTAVACQRSKFFRMR